MSIVLERSHMIISHVGLLLMGKILEWSKECICNSEKTCFDAIEFGTNTLKNRAFVR